MNIVLLTAYFPPETGSAANLFYELGGGLVKRGHEVTVITSLPSYYAQGNLNKYKGKQHMVERMGKMKVVRTAVPQLPRHIPVARAIWQFSLAYKFALVEMRLERPDVVLVYSPPLPLALSAWWLKKLKKVPFTLNVQDLFPQCAIDLGVLKNRLFIRFFEGFYIIIIHYI